MIPKEVFHYTKTSTALEKILFKKQLMIGQLKYTNDPKESKEHLFGEFIDPPPYKYSDISVLSAWTEKLLQIAKPIKLNEWKVLSFSINHPDLESDKLSIEENPFLSGAFRPTMWAHYGENHKGVCLKFNGNKLDEQIKKAFLDKKHEIFCGNIEYDDKWAIDGVSIFIDIGEVSKLNDIEFKEWLRHEYFIKNYKKIFLKKSMGWENEYEFRWLVYSENDSPEFISISDVTEEIIVGSDFEEAYYPSLDKFCKELGVQAYKVFWDNGKPGKVRLFR